MNRQPGIDYEPFRRWFSWLMPLVVVVDVGLFVVTMYLNNCPRNSSSCVVGFLGRFAFQPIKENPLLGPSSATLDKLGALEVNKVVRHHQAWRLVTSIWIHAGVVHLLANMISLLFIGIRLEREFGFVKIGLLYIISGFGANILSSLFLQSTISVGASGALFGLLGAMLSELLTNWTIYANKWEFFHTWTTLLILVDLLLGFFLGSYFLYGHNSDGLARSMLFLAILHDLINQSIKLISMFSGSPLLYF